jgi:hypothetical protein
VFGVDRALEVDLSAAERPLGLLEITGGQSASGVGKGGTAGGDLVTQTQQERDLDRNQRSKDRKDGPGQASAPAGPTLGRYWVLDVRRASHV